MTFRAKTILMTIFSLGMLNQLVYATTPYEYTKNNTTVYISAGQGNVKANELVYCQPANGCPVDYKLSHLIWESRDVTMLTTGFSYFNKTARLNFESQFVVSEGDSVMDDYDWQYINLDWSDWSHHEDTSLTEATTLDINLDFNIYEKDDTRLLFLIGYRKGTWAWDGRGGTYIYSTIPTDFRDISGSFTSGQRVISYEQQFSMPYIGFKIATSSGNWKFDFQYDYSNSVDLLSVDNHYLRDLVFKDDFQPGKMSAYKLGIGYQFDQKFDAFIRYDVQDYEELRGNTTYIDTTINAVTGGCYNCAGADNKSEVLSIGASYSF